MAWLASLKRIQLVLTWCRGAGQKLAGMDRCLRPLRHGGVLLSCRNSSTRNWPRWPRPRAEDPLHSPAHVPAKQDCWLVKQARECFRTVANAPALPEVQRLGLSGGPRSSGGLPRRTPQQSRAVAKANVLAPSDEHQTTTRAWTRLKQVFWSSAQLPGDEGVGQGDPNLHPDLRPLRRRRAGQIVKGLLQGLKQEDCV